MSCMVQYFTAQKVFETPCSSNNPYHLDYLYFSSDNVLGLIVYTISYLTFYAIYLPMHTHVYKG